MNARTRTEYESTVTIKNTDYDREMTAEVLSFQPGRRLEVSIERSVRLVMTWTRHPAVPAGGLYVGSVAGKEFTSHGPREVTYRLGR